MPVSVGEITLLDAGVVPRQPLRYRFTAGAREAIKLRQTINMRMEMDGRALPAQSMPPTLMTTELVVSDVAPDGSAGIALEFVEFDFEADSANSELMDAMRSTLADFEGVTMRYRVSPIGEVSQLEFGAGTPPEFQTMQSLGSTDQLSVAFPREAVGVGARWKSSRDVTQNGLTIAQEVEYLVNALSADSVLLELAFTQSAKDQPMDAAALPPGASITLRTLDGKGTSTVAIRFDRVQPAIDMTLRATMALELEMGGQVNAVNQSVVTDIRTTPTTPAAPPR